MHGKLFYVAANINVGCSSQPEIYRGKHLTAAIYSFDSGSRVPLHHTGRIIVYDVTFSRA